MYALCIAALLHTFTNNFVFFSLLLTIPMCHYPLSAHLSLPNPFHQYQPLPRPPPSPDTSANLSALQSQLIQTQSVLANHADKVKTFEGIIAEHENVKHEVQLMRDLMEQRKLEMESFISTSRMRSPESESNQLTNHLQITDGRFKRSWTMIATRGAF